MNDNGNGFLIVIIVVCFIVGYWVVNLIAKKLNIGQSDDANTDQSTSSEWEPQRDYSSGEKERGNTEEGWFRQGEPRKEEKEHANHFGESPDEEIRYARALGFEKTVPVGDVKRAFHEMLGKYHPDKVSHLGQEFKEIADKKTKEILAAYEYFRRKYNIS